ncbi:MAG: acyl--CoA ligase [Candidatus Omnitrophica bacterium]|nr:acyl--CoA ligase [Candidatus Omnitrophota bacterium]
MDFKVQLIRNAENYPDKPAVIFEQSSISFCELKEGSFKFANHLVTSGIKKLDKITVFLPNNLEAVLSYLGVLSMGAAIVPLDFMLTQEEIIHFINHSESKVLITQPKKSIDLMQVKSSCPGLRQIIVCKEKIDGFLFWQEVLERSSTDAPSLSSRPGDLSSIFYTSGSTGHPKGVMLTYKHFDNPVRSMDYFLDLTNQDIILCAGLPFSHVGGFDYLLVMLHLGSSMVLMERFQPLELLKNIEKFKVTFLWMVPSLYIAIVSLKEYDKFDLLSLRYVIVFGAPSSPVLLKRFHTMCPNAHFINGWGMTETAAPNCYLPPGIDTIESIGKFTPGLEAKIVDEQGKTLSAGQQGELWVKGEAVMAGYYKEPGLTAEVLTEDDWLKTGDIAKFDEQGLCYIVGRKKDMIKVSGEIVFSAEVEEKIHRHPKVKEVGVIGVADRLRGEVPKAFIVPKEGESIEVEEMRQFLKEHLAHFKLPHYFEFLSELPKNRAGKIDKHFLRKAGGQN